MKPLDGPRLHPRQGKPKSLVIFLHGYGADGNDLIDLGRAWQDLLPETGFISPHAPEPCGMSPMGRQWFELTFRNPHERWAGVQAAAPALTAFLQSQMDRYQLPAHAIALVGFSQGTMMALHTALRFPQPLAGVLGYSGMLVLPNGRGPDAVASDVVSRPPVMLIHGDQDEVIPNEALFMSSQALASLEVPVEWHVCAGLGHGIDPTGLKMGGAFLKRCLAPTG